MSRDQRRLAAIVSADVAGYSRLMERGEGGTLAALKAHRGELIDPKIAEYGGRIVKTTGDGLLLEFPSVVDAVRCAVDVQRGMGERNAGTSDKRIDFRSGINVGDIIIDGEDIFGDGVNVAARLQALADPGGICVSRVVRDQVLDKLSFSFEDLGAQKVKEYLQARRGVPGGPGGRAFGATEVRRFASTSPAGPIGRNNCGCCCSRGARIDAALAEFTAPRNRKRLPRCRSGWCRSLRHRVTLQWNSAPKR